MADRMFHGGGADGRSVMGMLAVQVEKDPKTGAVVVRSVAPTSAGAAGARAVFDDGRKSIHTVGGSGGQPSAEELGQILSAIDGVGMGALLEEVAVVPKKTKGKAENVPGALRDEPPPSSSHPAASTDNNVQFDGSFEAEQSVEGGDIKDDIMAAGDIGIEDMDDQRLKDGPVTLLFLGYTDATSGGGAGQDGEEGMLTAERVIITEDGDEYVLEPETAAAAPPESNKAAEQDEDKVSQDVPLDGAGAKVQSEDKGRSKPPSPTKAEGGDASKPKTCRCCSVM